jgi:hypothetical protein
VKTTKEDFEAKNLNFNLQISSNTQKSFTLVLQRIET